MNADMDKSSLPSVSDLAKLPFECLWLYAARSALRSLPVLVAKQKKFPYWAESHKRENLAAVSFSVLLGFYSPKRNQVITVRRAIDGVIKDRSGSTFGAAVGVSVSEVFKAASLVSDIVLRDTISEAVSDAVLSVSSSTIAFMSKTSHDLGEISYGMAVEAAALDFNFLIKTKTVHNLKSSPLWLNELSRNQQRYIQNIVKDFNDILDECYLNKFSIFYTKAFVGTIELKELSKSAVTELYESLGDLKHKRNKTKLEQREGGGFTVSISGKEQELLDEDAGDDTYLLDKGRLSTLSEKASFKDNLGRYRLVNALHELLSSEDDDPITVGLFGDWGTGKTSILKQLESRTGLSNCHVQWFQAWSYEHTADIQAGVAQEAITGLTSNLNFFQKIGVGLTLNFRTNGNKLLLNLLAVLMWVVCIFVVIANGGLLSSVLSTVFFIGLGISLSLYTAFRLLKPLFASTYAKELLTYLNLPDYSVPIGQLPVYQEQISQLADICLNTKESRWWRKKQEVNRRMIFVVDDLDRCSSETIVKVFDAIRLVMELEHISVLIAVDDRIALNALISHYQQLRGFPDRDDEYNNIIAREYLGKIIHLPVTLETPSSADIEAYAVNLFEDSMEDVIAENIDEVSVSPEASIEESKDEVSNTNDTVEHMVAHEDGFDTFAEGRSTLILHTERERKLFLDLCALYEFTNPRVIKRLYNSFRLMRSYYAPTTERYRTHFMIALFSIEYGESHTIDDFAWKKRLEKTKNLPEDISNYLKLNSHVDARRKAQLFVLPSLKT